MVFPAVSTALPSSSRIRGIGLLGIMALAPISRPGVLEYGVWEYEVWGVGVWGMGCWVQVLMNGASRIKRGLLKEQGNKHHIQLNKHD